MDAAPRPGQSDADVILGSLSSPDLFALLFERHAIAVFKFLRRQVPAEAAEDLLAETFVAAFRSRQNFDPVYPSARPWLMGIGANVARHHHRSETRRFTMWRRVRPRPVGPVDEWGEVDARLDEEAARPLLTGALDALTPSLREVLLLAASGLTYEETAVALGVPIGTVRSRLSRSRTRLRELLEPGGKYQLDRAAQPDEVRETGAFDD
jgi:RNA polymerase sigma-70 factor (ECF subfamily)